MPLGGGSSATLAAFLFISATTSALRNIKGQQVLINQRKESPKPLE